MIDGLIDGQRCYAYAEGFAVEGAARVRLDAQPVFSKEYRSFVKVREEKENVKTRELKRIDNNETDIKRPRPSLLKVRSSLSRCRILGIPHTHARWWLMAWCSRRRRRTWCRTR